ncbi:MAG: hypothetical protein LR015_12750 [Verrucomicrobia bacterium]|nr:hypothetical protein [Verrucomicrobiota bacterium]
MKISACGLVLLVCLPLFGTLNAAGLSHQLSDSNPVWHDSQIAHSQLLSEAAVSGAWMSSPWFGWFIDRGQGWISHAGLGFVRTLSESPDSLLLYDPVLGTWAWTSRQVFPWMYWLEPVAKWTYFSAGQTPRQRMFLDSSTQQWMMHRELVDKPTGRFIHWTRYSINSPDRFTRSAVLVKDGKIFSSPYSFSADGGITWEIIPSDGLGKTFSNLNGEFWVESYNLNSGNRTMVAVNGSGALTYASNDVGGHIAWEGGSTAYTYLNNAGSTFGGAWEDDYVLQTTDGGANWRPVPFQPPHDGSRGSIDRVWLIDGRLFVLSRIITQPGNITTFQLHLSNGDSWISSAEYPGAIALRKVTGHGVFASVGGGTYRVVFRGPAFTFEEIAFNDDFNDSTNTAGVVLNAGGKLLLATGFKLFIPDPATGRMYNPSPSSGDNSLPGIGSIVLWGDELVVTSGWFVYKTPFPFVFHEEP